MSKSSTDRLRGLLDHDQIVAYERTGLVLDWRNTDRNMMMKTGQKWLGGIKCGRKRDYNVGVVDNFYQRGLPASWYDDKICATRHLYLDL